MRNVFTKYRIRSGVSMGGSATDTATKRLKKSAGGTPVRVVAAQQHSERSYYEQPRAAVPHDPCCNSYYMAGALGQQAAGLAAFVEHLGRGADSGPRIGSRRISHSSCGAPRRWPRPAASPAVGAEGQGRLAQRPQASR